MRRFRNILVIVDGVNDNSVVLEQASMLSLQNEAQLTVAGVVKEIPRSLRLLAESKLSVELQSLVAEHREQELADMAASLSRSGLQVEVVTLHGTPFLEIIRQVLYARHDLVIIGADRGDGLRQALFGSTTMHLMRKCPCPVWVLKPTQAGQFRRVLAAVDPEPMHEDHFALDAKIMQLATSLARQYAADLHVVHAWTFEYESVFRWQETNITQIEMNRLLHEVREEQKQHLDALLSQYDLSDLPHKVHLVKGEARLVIPKLVRSQKIDLLVMGTVCRTGVAGLIMGNTAEDVLRHVDCSVLTVKPDGFKTPVTTRSRAGGSIKHEMMVETVGLVY